jgi:hypothetical protein
VCSDTLLTGSCWHNRCICIHHYCCSVVYRHAGTVCAPAVALHIALHLYTSSNTSNLAKANMHGVRAAAKILTRNILLCCYTRNHPCLLAAHTIHTECLAITMAAVQVLCSQDQMARHSVPRHHHHVYHISSSSSKQQQLLHSSAVSGVSVIKAVAADSTAVRSSCCNAQ